MLANSVRAEGAVSTWLYWTFRLLVKHAKYAIGNSPLASLGVELESVCVCVCVFLGGRG